MNSAATIRVERQTASLYEKLRAPEVRAESFRFLNPYLEGRRVLDLGCGAGVYLKEMGRESVGVDYSIPNLVECRESDLRVIRGDLNDPLPFTGSSFDSILISHSLEHMDAPIRLMREASRLLVPGGHLLIGLPFENSLVRWVLRDHYFRGHRTHFYSFSIDCLDQLAKHCGLSRAEIILDPPLIRRLRLQNFQGFFQKVPFFLGRWFCGNFWYVARKLPDPGKRRP